MLTLTTNSPPARPPAIIVGLDCITGLQSARILASRGVPVIALAAEPRHYCCRTRVCERIVHTAITGEALVETLRSLTVRGGDRGVLFPCTDASVLTISRYRSELQDDYEIVLPPHPVVEMLMDKVAFYRYASNQGLRTPSTRILTSASDADEAAESLIFPVVVKPALKTPEWQQNTKLKAIEVASGEELRRVYDRVGAWSETLIAQQWIEGGDSTLYSCNCYYGKSGEPLATFVARKLRQWPPHTGTSSLGEECRNDVVLEETLRLFGGVGYRGLGYLEMKQDARSGEHYIIEPNIGRPTGRSAIAEGGGVELLYTKYCDAVGLPLPKQRVQRYGRTKWIHVRADLQSAAVSWWRHELTISEWAHSLRGVRRDAVFSAADPKPFFADFWGRVGTAVTRHREGERSGATSRRQTATGGRRTMRETTRNRLSAASRSRAMATGVSLFEALSYSPRFLPILTYHRLADYDDSRHLDPTLAGVTPQEFKHHVDFLASRRRVISIADLLAAARGDRPIMQPSVMITFDDAYRNFATHAWPILRAAGIPVTLFVPTAYPDSERSFWWDRLHFAFHTTERREAVATRFGTLSLDGAQERTDSFRLVRRALSSSPHAVALEAVDDLVAELGSPDPPDNGVLTWAELSRLEQEGVALAPHTRTHPLLDRVPAAAAQAEVEGSLHDLERQVQDAQPAFAYPAGAYTDEVVQIVRDSGYAVALTTRRGTNDLERVDWFRLRRINVGRRSTLSLVRLQVAAPPLAAGRG